ncbi:ABC transporter substrate-binding protein [Streptomyces sp. NPDC004752]
MTRSGFAPRRATALAVGATLVSSLLTACSGSGADSAPNSITVSSVFTKADKTGYEFNRLARKFTQQTGIKVDVEEVGGSTDFPNAYEAAKLAGNERDLVVLNLTPRTSNWLPQGQVVDVKKYIDDWGLRSKIEPGALEYWTQGDKGVAGFPFLAFNWPIWYNMDLLKKAGVAKVPATTDELIADAHKLRAVGIQPMSLGGGDWPVMNFTTWMVQQYTAPDEAKKLFSKGGFCKSAGAVKGLDLFGRLRDEGVFVDNVQGYNADQMSSAYFSGKAAMMPAGSWAYTQVPAQVGKLTELSGFPVAPAGVYSKPTAFYGAGSGFFLSPNGEKKIGTIEKFLKFMYSQPSLQSWVSDGQQILAMKPEALGNAKASDPLVQKGISVTNRTVDFMVLPDNYLPAGMDYAPVGTEFLGHKGATGATYCKALDKLYVDQ